MTRRLFLIVAAVAVALGAAAVHAGASSATYQGGNGRLTFSVLGRNVDVYSVLPSGRRVRRLTSDKAFDACPSWSRDGRTIAYCSDASGRYEIWTMRADGNGKHRETDLESNATFPDLSPDGRTIVFYDCAKTCRIMSVDRATGKEKVLVDDPTADDTDPVWSPNGRTIAFLRTKKSGAAQILLAHRDGTGVRALTRETKPFGPFGPDWKPDGSLLAYGAQGDIWTVDLRGRTRRLTRDKPSEYAPAWAPDGSKIAYLHGLGGARRVFAMRADGTGAHVVAGSLGGPQLAPSWQPLPRR